MPTYDWIGTDIIPNGSGSAVRADLNDAMLALFSQNSSATSPPETVAYMVWADTTTGLLKIRNAANSAWVTVGTLASANLGLATLASPTFTGTPAAPTASVGTNTTQLATTAFVLANAVVVTGDTMTGNLTVPSLNGGQLAGMRNEIINGAMAVDQRNAGASQTFTAAAALAYSVDRWYGYCTGANVTGQQVAGAAAGQFRYRFTGAASVTAIGFGQRIEQLNSADLASTTATLSVDLANSLLTTVTWTAFYANTANTFGTLASPTRTQIATGTFTVTSTVTRYSTNISVPGAATTGIEIVFTVGAQTSGTWTIGNVQLEPGSVTTPFERRSYGAELALCQRYFETSYPAGTAVGAATTAVGIGGISLNISDLYTSYSPTPFVVPKRASPTINFYAGTTGQAGVLYNNSASSVQGNAGSRFVSQYGCTLYCSNNAMTAANAFSVNFTASSEL